MLRCVLDGFPGILVEASAAGDPEALLQSFCFGVFLGAFYDLFRVVRVAIGLHPQMRAGKWTERLRSLSFRSLGRLCGQSQNGREDDRQTPRRWQTVLSAVRRSFRRLPDAGWWASLLLDLLFAILSAMFGAVFVYAANSGVLRWYILLLTGTGFFLYYRTVGTLVMRAAVFLFSVVQAVAVVLFNRILYYPCKGMLCLCCRVRSVKRFFPRRKRMKRKEG